MARYYTLHHLAIVRETSSGSFLCHLRYVDKFEQSLQSAMAAILPLVLFLMLCLEDSGDN
jgi:hypothetical protein